MDRRRWTWYLGRATLILLKTLYIIGGIIVIVGFGILFLLLSFAFSPNGVRSRRNSITFGRRR